MESIKKVLVPTDFTVKSLNLVVDIIEQSKEEKLEIVLLHGVDISSSIPEILFFSKAKLLRSLQTPEFVDSCNLIKNKFQSRIVAMYADIITGDTRAYFNNYIEANEIDEIYIPVSYKMEFRNKQSFDVCSLLRKVTGKKVEINWPEYLQHHTVPTGQVADLFFARID